MLSLLWLGGCPLLLLEFIYLGGHLPGASAMPPGHPCSYSHAHRAPWVTLGHLLLQSISRCHQAPLFLHGSHPRLHRRGGRNFTDGLHHLLPPSEPRDWFLRSSQPWYWLTEPPPTNHFQMAWVTLSWSRSIKGGLSVMPYTTLTTAHSFNL